MICPLCRCKLTVIDLSKNSYIMQACLETSCYKFRFPRYEVIYDRWPTTLNSRSIVLDNYYIELDYKNSNTTISKLEICFIADSVYIPYLLSFNVLQPKDLLKRINILLPFS
jgi:hypothetical protein